MGIPVVKNEYVGQAHNCLCWTKLFYRKHFFILQFSQEMHEHGPKADIYLESGHNIRGRATFIPMKVA